MDAAQHLAAPPPSEAQVWDWLSALTDPEIPVVTLREMGILRGVEVQRDHIQVTITPTYSGCPAMSQIEDDIVAQLARHGQQARVITQLAPAWTTDWMSKEAHEKLRAYGIAPPLVCASTSSSAHTKEAQTHVLTFAKRRDAQQVP